MKVVVSVEKLDGNNIVFSLEEEAFVICENDGKTLIECNEEERFNTLISLFSLKESWDNKLEVGQYRVVFEKNGELENFNFEKNLPDNWPVFCAHFSKLVGETK